MPILAPLTAPGRRARPALLAVALALLALGVDAAAAVAQPIPATGPRVVLVFLPARDKPPKTAPTAPNPPAPTAEVLGELAARRQLSLGLLGATQGTYSQEQTLLDLTQGTRTSAATYSTRQPWPMRLVRAGSAGFIDGWLPNKHRGERAPAAIHPGLLASAIPGGGTYVGFSRHRALEAAGASDSQGTVRRVSLGAPASLAERARQLRRRHRFLVVSLPLGRRGLSELDEVLAARAPRELLLVVQAPPELNAPQLLPMGAVGLRRGAPGGLSSPSTRQPGMVAGIDLAPTVLRHLGLAVPADVRGQSIGVAGPRDPAALQALADRLTNVGKSRLLVVQGMVLGWLALLLGLGAVAGWYAQRRRGLRLGALAVMWAPTLVLVEALVDAQNLAGELAVVVAPSFLLAWLTDRWLPWPRGPMLPVATAFVGYSLDLANSSHLIARSLLGPNPKFGSRYFGVGNELEITLAVMLFVGLAAALTGWPRSRRLAGTFAGAGMLLAAIVGAGRLGADVGGVITIGTGTAVATLLLLPKRPSIPVIAGVALTPLLGLGLLALFDLATAANGHFTRSVLDQGGGNLLDVLARRSELAFNALVNGRRMPFVVAAGAIAVGFAVRNRRWLYGHLPDPVWRAALLASLSAGVVGSLANDSGPLLFVVAAFGLMVITAYIQGDPRLTNYDAARQRALTQASASGPQPARDAPLAEDAALTRVAT